MRRLWGSPGIAPEAGLASTELVEALEDGRVKVLWIVATNPVVSQPDAGRFAAALRRAELVVVQDAYFPTETGALAHVLLPAAGLAGEGRDDDELRAAGVAWSRAPWIRPARRCRTGRSSRASGGALGFREAFAWRSAAQVHAEYVRTTEGRVCDQSGLSHARLRRDGPLQWPVPSVEHPGTERLYGARRFSFPDGRARLAPTPHTAPADPVSPDYPLVLTTGRVAQQWHTMTRTGKSPSLLSAEPHPFVELHASDAEGLEDGERVRVRSRRGSVVLRLRVSDRVPPGVAFAPFHWGALHAEPGAGAVNNVTARDVDPVSLQPELKACAVRVEPVGVAVVPDAPGRRLVIVGAGMAGMAVADAVLAHDPDWQITLVGREPDAPYNRVLLSQALAGDISDERLALRQPSGVSLRLGAAVRAVDTRARTVELEDGVVLPYDSLVLATGSAPWLPPVAGLERALAFRSIADMRAIRAAAASASRAVVVGGGLLGLEAARGLRELGVDVTVVHLADRLMELQLDGLAARLAGAADPGAGDRRAVRAADRGDHRRRASCSPTASSFPPISSSSPPASGPRWGWRATPASRSRAACSSTTTCGRARPACGRWGSAPSTAGRSTGCGRRCSSRRARRGRRSRGVRRRSSARCPRRP